MDYAFKLFEFEIYNDKGIEQDSDEDENENYVFKKDTSKFIIEMYGMNEKGKVASIIVEDYQTFFYLKVNDNWGQTKKIEFY